MKTHVDLEDVGLTSSECRCCGRKLFEEHSWECIIPKRRVKLEVTLQYEVLVPRSWDSESIEFVETEKGCFSNIIQDLIEYSDRLDKENPENCSVANPDVKFIAEVEEA